MRVRSCVHQEGGPGDGEGLLVEVGRAEEKQDVAGVLLLVQMQHVRQVAQLVQVGGKLQPGREERGGQHTRWTERERERERASESGSV